MKTGKKYSIVFLTTLWSMAAFIIIFSQEFQIAVNKTESIPYRYFLIWKGHIEAGKGHYMAFYAPENGRYHPAKAFIKRVVGTGGDKVQEKAGNFFVNDSLIGPWFKTDSKNRPLHPGPTGTIPDHYYFMAGAHAESFDSRYQEIGWIHEKNLIGRAYPLF